MVNWKTWVYKNFLCDLGETGVAISLFCWVVVGVERFHSVKLLHVSPLPLTLVLRCARLARRGKKKVKSAWEEFWVFPLRVAQLWSTFMWNFSLNALAQHTTKKKCFAFVSCAILRSRNETKWKKKKTWPDTTKRLERTVLRLSRWAKRAARLLRLFAHCCRGWSWFR